MHWTEAEIFVKRSALRGRAEVWGGKKRTKVFDIGAKPTEASNPQKSKLVRTPRIGVKYLEMACFKS